MKLHFGHSGSIESVSAAISLYGTKEFESPTRSTIPMLSLLIHDPALFKTIVGELGMPENCDPFLEYTLRSPKGRGKASHTDVMLKAGSDALAIEAKWTEQMYDTVARWISGTKEGNGSLVLEGWLDLLQQRVSKQLVPGEFDDAIYQMVHRAASAAATGTNPRLAYFLFKPSSNQSATPKDIKQRLTELWEKLGSPEDFPFYVVQIDLLETEAQKSLRSRPKGEETSELVSAVLQSDLPLFSFENYRVQQVGRPR